VLVVYDAHTEVARHERLIAKGGSRLELDHYLEALVRKPGALPGATALDQARSAGKFTPVHDAWWQAACTAHGDAEGTRALISVLLLHRHMVHEHAVAGIATALRAGALTADAVALEARKWGEADQGAEQPADQDAPAPDRHRLLPAGRHPRPRRTEGLRGRRGLQKAAPSYGGRARRHPSPVLYLPGSTVRSGVESLLLLSSAVKCLYRSTG
jgi:hypothetical protein